MGASLGVEIVQIGDVLEKVRRLVAVLHSGVGEDVVGILGDHQFDALFLQDIHALVQNFGMRGGGSGNLEGGRFFTAAGGQAQGQNQSQEEGKNLGYAPPSGKVPLPLCAREGRRDRRCLNRRKGLFISSVCRCAPTSG